MGTGIALILAGKAMRIPAPMFLEVDPNEVDPNTGAPRVRAGMTSATHSPTELGLGVGGSLVEAIGATLFQLGSQLRRP